MPLCDVPHRYNVTIAVGDRLSEYRLELVNTQRVITQRAVPEIRTYLTFSARAHFLKSGGKLYEIPPQSRYSRFAKLRDSNGLHFQSHLRGRLL
jgi:hypothetical protein